MAFKPIWAPPSEPNIWVAARYGHLYDVKIQLDGSRDPVLDMQEPYAVRLLCYGPANMLPASAMPADNYTPLMWAAYGGHRTVVEYLVGRGADPNLTDKSGTRTAAAISRTAAMIGRPAIARTAAMIARENGKAELADLLSSMEKMTKEERMAKWGEQATMAGSGVAAALDISDSVAPKVQRLNLGSSVTQSFGQGWVVPNALVAWEHNIGGGGFASVYQVRVYGEVVAAKQMSYTTDGERPNVERVLRREFRALKQANGHPNIVQLRGIVLDAPNSLSLLMERSPIGHLRARLDQSPLDSAAQRTILKGIAEGMASLHAQLPTPILHHDLKSQNVLLFPDAGSEHVAKISDFGMATGAKRATHSVVTAGPMGSMKMGAGTFVYKAPECYKKRFFKASDVYAYAIIGFEVLTRDVPWKEEDETSLTLAVFFEQRRPGPLPDTPLGEMVKACWAQEHSERPSFAQLTVSPALTPSAAPSAAPSHATWEESQLAQELAALHHELAAMNARNERVFQTLQNHLQNHQQILTALVMNEHDCPRVPWLKPETHTFLQHLNPATWTANKFSLYFVCPVSKKIAGGPDGNGYPISLPKGWVVTYGPAIKIGLQVISLVLETGNAVGLPLGPLGHAIQAGVQAEQAAVARLESVLGEHLAELACDAAADAVNDVFNALDVSQPDPIPGEGVADATAARQVTGAAYRALRALIAQKDATLQHCGLEMVVANDGAVDWVHPSAKEHFKRDGRKAYFWHSASRVR